jgi:hypothetical protein
LCFLSCDFLFVFICACGSLDGGACALGDLLCQLLLGGCCCGLSVILGSGLSLAAVVVAADAALLLLSVPMTAPCY